MNSKINKVIFAEMKEFFNTCSEETEMISDADELYSYMVEHFKDLNIEKKTKTKTKSKNTKQRPVYEDTQRCIGLKANGERCSNKKFVKGDNPELCSIHNKKPPKKFFTEADHNDDTEIEEETEEDNEEETCCYKFISKNKKNELCNKKCSKGKKLCSTHLKNVEYIKNMNNKESETEEVIEEGQNENENEKEVLFGDSEEE